MTTEETDYRMRIVGSFSGFSAWAASESVPWYVGRLSGKVPSEDIAALSSRLDLVLSAAFVSFLMALCAGQWWGGRTAVSRWLAALGSLVFGAVTGWECVRLLEWSQRGWAAAAPFWIPRLAVWCVLGMGTGLVLGVVQSGLKPRRVALCLAGGGLGGFVGGLVAVFLSGYVPYLFHAVALTFTGLMIAEFSNRAPTIASRARLEFEGSDDPAVNLHFAHKAAVWEFLPGDSYLFGSGESGDGDVQFVYVPDPEMADNALFGAFFGPRDPG